MKPVDWIGLGIVIVIVQAFVGVIIMVAKDYLHHKRLQKEAISRGYATYDKDLEFKWKDEAEKQ